MDNKELQELTVKMHQAAFKVLKKYNPKRKMLSELDILIIQECAEIAASHKKEVMG